MIGCENVGGQAHRGIAINYILEKCFHCHCNLCREAACNKGKLGALRKHSLQWDPVEPDQLGAAVSVAEVLGGVA
jgi:hypothetical protein